MNFTLGKKLALSFGSIVLLVFAVSSIVYVKLATMRETAGDILEVRTSTASGSSLLRGVLDADTEKCGRRHARRAAQSRGDGENEESLPPFLANRGEGHRIAADAERVRNYRADRTITSPLPPGATSGVGYLNIAFIYASNYGRVSPIQDVGANGGNYFANRFSLAQLRTSGFDDHSVYKNQPCSFRDH